MIKIGDVEVMGIRKAIKGMRNAIGFKGVPGDDAYGVRPTDKTLWWQMIQLLPSSFNQMRTIDLNYETLLLIYRQRKGHKLDEWRDFCKWIETLPYMKEFLGLDEQVEKEKRELS